MSDPVTERAVLATETDELCDIANSNLQAMLNEREMRIAAEAQRDAALAALRDLLAACEAGRIVIKPGCGVGGQTIEANLRASQINGVDAWAVEKAREALTEYAVPESGGENA